MTVFRENVEGDWEAGLLGFADHLRNDVARVGAQAMAQMVYEDAKRNVPVSGVPTHYFYGTAAKSAAPGQKKALAYVFHSGDLRNAVYQVFSKDQSGKDRKEYHIGWNHKKAPYGFMVEFGTVNASAHPFLYPAFANNKSALLPAACEAMRSAIAGWVV